VVRELSVLVGVCVLAMFFVPAVQGPYSATHGPVTAMQAARAGVRVRITIAQNALNGGGHSPVLPLTILFGLSVPTPESPVGPARVRHDPALLIFLSSFFCMSPLIFSIEQGLVVVPGELTRV